MKITTNDRELGCLLLALNASKPESSQSNRRRKLLAYEQLGLEKLEEAASVGGPLETIPVPRWPTEERFVDIEKGVRHYLLDKFGAEGEINVPAFVERSMCRFIDRLQKMDE